MFLASFVRGFLRTSVIIALLAALLPEVHGEKRIFAKVNPNAGATNGPAEIYDPATGKFTALGSQMGVPREAHSAILLKSGQVLLAGGYDGSYLANAEIYDPGSQTFSPASGVMAQARSNLAAVLLSTGKVLLTGGFNGSTVRNDGELFDPATGSFSSISAALTAAREFHTATLLSDGKVLLAGGDNGAITTSGANAYLTSAELFDPGAGTFTATTGSLNVARRGQTATLLPGGKVLLAGGQNIDGYLSSAELYDPSTKKFTTTSGAMTVARAGHIAVLLADGKVLIAGGFNGSYLNSAEIYDPSTDKFTASSSPMSAARSGHAAALLASGKVLISGGYNGTYLSSAELFDPGAGSFSALGASMSAARDLHAATVLPDGKVLVTGGQNTDILRFDLNSDSADNIAPNIVLTSDGKTGFAAYTGSGVVLAFSPQTGQVLKRISTGGYPALATPLKDGKTLAVVSVLDNRIFLIDMPTLQLRSTYSFNNAQFTFGSYLAVSPDGGTGYVSSTGTAEVIKFSIADGKESGRMTGLQTPTQITVTPDGATILIVDTTAVELVFADSSSLSRQKTLKPRDSVATATLTVFNKAVLAPDGLSGALATRDAGGSLFPGQLFVFKVPTADILYSGRVGSLPGYMALTPDGQNYLLLCETSVTLIPVNNPGGLVDIMTAQGDPLGSANIVFSPDSRYAYYVSSANDLVFQHDLTTTGVVGQVLVGDFPNRALDQPATLAIDTDGKTIAALEMEGNRIDLLTDSTVLTSTKFLLSNDLFSGLSLVNLSSTPTKFTITALDNYGSDITADGVTNPLVLTLGPNNQISKNVGELFGFDPSTEHSGRIQVAADQPQVAGYLTIGQIRPTWLGFYLNKMDGVPLLQNVAVDWIVPEIGRDNGETVQMEIVNPNYTAQSYDLLRYGQDGTVIDQKTAQSAPLTNRLEQNFADQFAATSQAKVLITGGQASNTPSSTAEEYDLTALTFAATGFMTAPRQGHSATLMLDGRVLIAGGKNSNGVLDSAETYSIVAGTFTASTFPMTVNRYRHTATLLPSGRVLLAGGQNPTSVNNSAELFDPNTNNFTATSGSMTTPRDSHTATLLNNGKVLITGGIDGNVVTNTAEIYDPATGKFTATGSMSTARVFHTATLLSSGRVLIAGGFNGSFIDTAEIYDPVAGNFSPTAGGLSVARDLQTATLLSDGTVLLAGGTTSAGVTSSAEIFDPSTSSFIVAAGAMTTARSAHSATLEGNNKVVLIGGTDGTDDLKTAETYDPSSQTFQTTTGSMTEARNSHRATLLQSGAEGYLRGFCKQGLMFSEFYGASRDNGALNSIDIGKFAGTGSIYAPQFATVAGFSTILNLINANPVGDAQITITLHSSDGKVIGTPATRTLLQNAQIKADLVNIFQSDPAVINKTGWIEITSTVDKVLGTVTYTNTDGTFLASLELSPRPMSRFVFPVAAEDSMYETGISLLNTGSQTANVTIELWGPGGTVDRTASVKLAPKTSIAQYLSDYFPNLSPHLVANVRVQSDQPIHGIALMNDRLLNFLAAIPPLPIPNK